MGRFLFIVGLLLIFASIGYMLFAFTGNEIIAGVVCEEGETLTQQHRQTFSGGESGSTTDFFCEDAEGVSRDVTGMMIAIIAGGFLVIFFPGLIMTILGGRGMAKRGTQQFMTNALGGQQLGNVSQYQGQSPEQIQATLQQAFSQAGKTPPQSGGGTLADRLRQLDDAYQDSLISKEEYDRMRQAILDNTD